MVFSLQEAQEAIASRDAIITTQGETLEEAKRMAEDAIKGYLETLMQDDLPIPLEHSNERLAVSV